MVISMAIAIATAAGYVPTVPTQGVLPLLFQADIFEHENDRNNSTVSQLSWDVLKQAAITIPYIPSYQLTLAISYRKRSKEVNK